MSMANTGVINSRNGAALNRRMDKHAINYRSRITQSDLWPHNSSVDHPLPYKIVTAGSSARLGRPRLTAF